MQRLTTTEARKKDAREKIEQVRAALKGGLPEKIIGCELAFRGGEDQRLGAFHAHRANL